MVYVFVYYRSISNEFFTNYAKLRKMGLLNMKIVRQLHFLNVIGLNDPKVLWEYKRRVISIIAI